MKAKRPPLYYRVREIIESARAGAARSVITAQVVSNWLIGREIVDYPGLAGPRKGYAVRSLSRTETPAGGLAKGHTPSSQSSSRGDCIQVYPATFTLPRWKRIAIVI